MQEIADLGYDYEPQHVSFKLSGDYEVLSDSAVERDR